RQEVNDAISAATRTRTVQEWCERLAAADVPHAPVLSVADALQHPQLRARGLVRSIDHPAVGRTQTLGPPIQFEGVDGTMRPAPTLGADTVAVLREVLAYPDDRIERLLAGLVAATG